MDFQVTLPSDPGGPTAAIPHYRPPLILLQIGHYALDAIGWEHFWATHRTAEQVSWEYDVAGFDQSRKFWNEDDKDWIRLMIPYGLYSHLSWKEGRVDMRLKALFGAVWVDAERNLEQVKDVLRVLRLFDENGFRSVPAAAGVVTG